MPRTINDAGLDLIRQFEGLRLDAYQDVRGIWTIGYGHAQGVVPGTSITEDQAVLYLKDDLLTAEGAVARGVGAAVTTDNQFAAMVSLCFNIGSGNFLDSTVLRAHVQGDRAEAADAFLLWNKTHIGGILQPVAGLTARRKAERELYLT